MIHARAASRDGFTLLEAVLGLALVGMIVLVALSANGRALRAIEEAQTREAAAELARNVAEERMGPILSDVDPPPDVPEGLRLQVRSEERELTESVVLQEVTISITEDRPEGRALCTLQILLPIEEGPAAARVPRGD